MALTEIPSELSSTPSIVDNGNATAITIGSDESVTFSGGVDVTDTATMGNALIDSTGNATLNFLTYSGSQNVTANIAVGRAEFSGPASSMYFQTNNGTALSTAMTITDDGNVGIGGVGNISPYGIRFAINGTGTGGAGLYFGSGVIIPTDNTPTISDATVDLGASNYRFKDLYLSGVANVGSIVQTGSTSSLVASFENTNTSGYGMRITTYSSGVEYALAVDSYGGGYSRDFVIGVNGYIYSPQPML